MKRILRIAVAVVLVALVAAFVDWRAVWRVLKDVNAWWIAAAFGLVVIDRLLVNIRYDLLLRARGLHIGFGRVLRIQLLANFLGSFLPSSVGVDAVRIAALCRSGLPAAPVVAATLIDRISLAVATLLFGSLMLLMLAGTRIPGHVTQFVLGATVIIVVLLALGLLPAVRRMVRLRLVPRLPERIRGMVLQVSDAALAYRHQLPALAWTLLATVGLFLVRIGFAKALALACALDVPYVDLLLVIPVLWIIVMLPITIGGIGVQDMGYVVLMSLIGVGPAVAVSMSILEHVISRVASLPGVLFLDEASRRAARQPVSGI